MQQKKNQDLTSECLTAIPFSIEDDIAIVHNLPNHVEQPMRLSNIEGKIPCAPLIMVNNSIPFNDFNEASPNTVPHSSIGIITSLNLALTGSARVCPPVVVFS